MQFNETSDKERYVILFSPAAYNKQMKADGLFVDKMRFWKRRDNKTLT